MAAIDDSGPAFPFPAGEGHPACPGMSLRDWFAGMAMQAEMGATDAVVNVHLIAPAAYCMADAMLAARKAEGAD